MFYITHKLTGLLLATDGASLVDMCQDAMAFKTFGAASDFCQNLSDDYEVECNA